MTAQSTGFDAATIANMRGRIDWCRQLAKGCKDEKVAASLRRMADDIEADVKRLEANGL